MYIIFKDKKSKRSHKAVGIKVFLTFLIGDRRIQIRSRIRIRINTSDWWIRIQVQKHVDPVDPDSDGQHWFQVSERGLWNENGRSCLLGLAGERTECIFGLENRRKSGKKYWRWLVSYFMFEERWVRYKKTEEWWDKQRLRKVETDKSWRGVSYTKS